MEIIFFLRGNWERSSAGRGCDLFFYVLSPILLKVEKYLSSSSSSPFSLVSRPSRSITHHGHSSPRFFRQSQKYLLPNELNNEQDTQKKTHCVSLFRRLLLLLPPLTKKSQVKE